MKKMFFPLMLAAFFCCSSPAHAAGLWTGLKQVTQVWPVPTGGFLISFSTSVNSICTAQGTNTLYIYPDQNYVTQEGAAALLATALTALTTGMSVNVYYDDSTVYCYGSQLKISK